jgi:hypothetical protein
VASTSALPTSPCPHYASLLSPLPATPDGLPPHGGGSCSAPPCTAGTSGCAWLT